MSRTRPFSSNQGGQFGVPPHGDTVVARRGYVLNNCDNLEIIDPGQRFYHEPVRGPSSTHGSGGADAPTAWRPLRRTFPYRRTFADISYHLLPRAISTCGEIGQVALRSIRALAEAAVDACETWKAQVGVRLSQVEMWP